MKNVLFSLAAVSVLVFSGCSNKNPEIDNAVSNNSVASEASGVDSVDQNLDNIKGSLNSVYFDFDKFNIRQDMQKIVVDDANILNQKDAEGLTIKLEGNCDEWGTDEYNMALGLKRANVVKQSLVSRGISENRIQTVSFGKNNSVCNEKTKSCWAQNRRVDFSLSK